MTEFNPGYPSVRRIQTCIKEKGGVELKLITGDIIVGTILWQDVHGLYLETQDYHHLMIYHRAIAYIYFRQN